MTIIFYSPSIAQRFKALMDNLQIDGPTENAISLQAKAITQQINADFWGIESDTLNRYFIGSYGRGTAIKGIDDIDLAMELPPALLEEYQRNPHNGAEALLQKVQGSIARVYPQSIIGEDGRTINIDFPNLKFEVLPVFRQADQSYLYPHASYGGRWRIARLLPEIQAIEAIDQKHNGKIRHLVKMMVAWKLHNHVPISGLLLETLAMDFFDFWPHHDQTYPYYGVMTTDFLQYLSQQDRNQKHWLARGSEQFVYRMGTFENQAQQSLEVARTALRLESEQQEKKANQQWHRIFGDFLSNPDTSRE